MKRSLSLLTALLMLLSVLPSVTLFAADGGSTTPGAEIFAYNLVDDGDNKYISYAVNFENVPAGAELGLLVWSSYQSSYEYSNAEYKLSPAYQNGSCYVFEFKNMTSKQMTDDFYSVAYVLSGGKYYYSELKKYSILQYAYNKLGYTGTRTDSEALADYLASMLAFGAASQLQENYNTDRLATDTYYQVKTVDSVLYDGTTSGLYKTGEELTLTYKGTQTAGGVTWKTEFERPVAYTRVSGGAAEPASYVVGDKNETLTPKPTYRFVFFGDAMVSHYNFADIFSQFAAADGITITSIIPVTNLLQTSKVANIYGLLNSDKTEITNTTLLKAIQDPTPVDYFFAFTGRDFSLIYSDSERNEQAALVVIKQALLTDNPDAKIILASPYGYQDNSPWFDDNFGFISQYETKYVSTKAAPNRLRSEHNATLKTRTAALKSALGNMCITPQVGDGFEFYYNNYYDEYGIDLYDDSLRNPSPAGAYFSAAILYAQVFGNTPYGSDVYGKLSKEDAVKLQKIAHEYVFGSAPQDEAEEKSAVLFIEPDRTPSPYFKDEYFDENYKYLLETALSYRSHGKWIEYDQYAINPYALSGMLYRRDENAAPEDASPQRTIHLDCSGFVYSVYMQAFGYGFFNGSGNATNQTADMIQLTEKQGVVYSYSYATDSAKEPPEQAIQRFIDTLQPGDVLIYRTTSNTGHTMLYLQNGQFIHSSGGNGFSVTGSDYNFVGMFDKCDIPGAIYYNDITNLILPTQSRYIFGSNISTIKVVRPFKLGLKPTASAKVRAEKLVGITAYQLTSCPEGVTVSPGDEVEFTVVVQNYGSETKTLKVSETLPSGFTYTQGSGNFSFTIAPGEVQSFTCKVKVPASQKEGTVTYNTLLEGLPLTSTPINVARTMTSDEQSAFRSGALEALNTSNNDLALVKAAYSRIGKTISYSSNTAIYNDICQTYSDNHRLRNPDDSYQRDSSGNLITASNKATILKRPSWTGNRRAPNVFGGKAFTNGTLIRPSDRRIRALNGYNFVCGDVLVVVDDIASSDITLYLCLGENEFITVKDGAPVRISGSSETLMFLETLFGRDVFFVIRPSKNF